MFRIKDKRHVVREPESEEEDDKALCWRATKGAWVEKNKNKTKQKGRDTLI
jgi:hypothetical protein